jgi:oxygen-independent coproporphyrinogen-3 oxidase
MLAPPSSYERTPSGFGIYVHIPFCRHRCSYCDFFSLTNVDAERWERTADGLIAEIGREKERWSRWGGGERPITSVFFGGGTPSWMPPRQLARVVKALLDAFPKAASAEWTLETNPETVDADFGSRLGETPFRRVSLGVQSFRQELLDRLDRRVGAAAIHRAIERLRPYVARLSVDLIFGIPGQTAAEVREDVERASALGTDHVSFYQLTLKPGHPLHSRLPSDDESAALYEVGFDALERAGFTRYEVSNFARPEALCAHNWLYWSGGDYLGVGPSASSRVFDDGVFSHRKGYADWSKWLRSVEGAEAAPPFERSTPWETVLEALVSELRTPVGVATGAFQARYRWAIEGAPAFPTLLREGLLERWEDSRGVERIAPSRRGVLLADGLAEALAPSAAAFLAATRFDLGRESTAGRR